MTSVVDLPPAASHPLLPVPWRVVDRRAETADVVTLSLVPPAERWPAFRPGQFNMLTAFGVGEVAVSISSSPTGAGWVEHTVRDVGPVTGALCRLTSGDVVGVRGPFGTDWGLDRLGPGDVVVVAGGIGLAPLRGAVRELLVGSAPRRRVVVLVGARAPGQILYGAELVAWRAAGAQVEVTVDVATPAWRGAVGVVTGLLAVARFDPARATALVCGPEIMMRFVARALVDRGVDPAGIRVSLERNMQCGVGLCGHCQLGPILVCRDGPVVDYGDTVARLLSERER